MSVGKHDAAKACRKVGVMNTKIAAVISNTRDSGEMNVDKVEKLAGMINNMLWVCVENEKSDHERMTALDDMADALEDMADTMGMADTIVALLAICSTSLIRLGNEKYWTSPTTRKEMEKELSRLMDQARKGKDNG